MTSKNSTNAAITLRQFMAIAPNIIIPGGCSISVEYPDDDCGKHVSIEHISELEPYLDCEICEFVQEYYFGELDCQYIRLKDVPVNEAAIYTHDEASIIVDIFESVLSEYGITVPSPEDNERHADDMLGLYGSTYDSILSSVEDRICCILDRHDEDTKVVCDEFSGLV